MLSMHTINQNPTKSRVICITLISSFDNFLLSLLIYLHIIGQMCSNFSQVLAIPLERVQHFLFLLKFALISPVHIALMLELDF